MSEAETTEGAEPKTPEEAAAPEAESSAPKADDAGKVDAAPKADEAEKVDAAPKTDAASAATTPAYQPPYVFLVVVSTVTLVADLGSKWWAVNKLGPAKVHEAFDGLRFVLAHNPGGAWGLLHDENVSVRVPFFILVSIVAIAFIVSLYRKLAPDQAALRWGLPLVLGGALGNLIDRIRYQHVIDFIDMYTKPGTTMDNIITALPAFIRVKLFGPVVGSGYHWPTYNIADIAIVAGVLLMAVDMFTSRKAEKNAAAQKAAEPPAS